VAVARIVFAGLALAGFLLSAWVHVSALRGVDVSQAWPQVWGLHVGLFVVFVPMVLAIRRQFGRGAARPRWRELLPRPVALLCGAVVVYAAVNFGVVFMRMPGSSVKEHDGQCVVIDHGVRRTLSDGECAAFHTSVLRMFSGHWMAFYFAPFAFFTFVARPRPGFGAPLGGGGR